MDKILAKELDITLEENGSLMGKLNNTHLEKLQELKLVGADKTLPPTLKKGAFKNIALDEFSVKTTTGDLVSDLKLDNFSLEKRLAADSSLNDMKKVYQRIQSTNNKIFADEIDNLSKKLSSKAEQLEDLKNKSLDPFEKQKLELELSKLKMEMDTKIKTSELELPKSLQSNLKSKYSELNKALKTLPY